MIQCFPRRGAFSELQLEHAGQLSDVLNGVFERLDLGERLRAAAVHRRKILAELMQRLRQTAHAQLLALAGLHPPLHAHLRFGRPLLVSVAGVRRGRAVLSAPVPARAERVHVRQESAQKTNFAAFIAAEFKELCHSRANEAMSANNVKEKRK